MNFCWVTLYVSNMAASLDFYTRIIGLDISSSFKVGETREIVFLGTQETKVELIHDTHKEQIMHGKDISLGFEVSSLDKTMDLLRQENCAVAAGPFQPNPKMKFIYIADPDGVKIQLAEMKK